MTFPRALPASLALSLLLPLGIHAQTASEPLFLGSHRFAVKSLTVEVRGVDAINWKDLEKHLTDRLTLSSDISPSPPLADDLAFFTRQFLVEGGFPKATVDWRIEAPGIVLTIESGVQVLLGAVDWTGNTVLDPAELEPYLLSPTKERSSGPLTGRPYVQRDIDQGVDLVKSRLRADGYLEAQVTVQPAPILGPNFERSLSVHVEPGPAFEFGSLHHEGAPQELQEPMSTLLREIPGGPFNEARVQKLESELKSACVSRGYLNTQITSAYTLGTTGGTVDVDFQISPGARFRILAIDPHPGFTNGAERVLRAHFNPAQGRFYSAKDLDFMYRRAISTNLFARLDYEARPIDPSAPEADTVDARLRLTGEQVKPHTLGVQAGFDTFLGPQIGLRYRNSNLLDSGNTLAAEATWSQGGPLGSLEFSNPALFGTPYAATARASAEQFSLFDYTRNSGGLNLQLARRVSDPLSFTVFFAASKNSVSTTVLTPAELGPERYTLASVGASLLYDQRNSTVLPTKGWFLSARGEQVFNLEGDSFSYHRTDFEGAFFHPVTKRLRFATGVALQSVVGEGARDLPIDNRVFNGGPNSVRSFYERELGPRSAAGDTPLGGTASFVGSAELSYEFLPNFEFALFTDVGSLSEQDHGSVFEFSTDFRCAVGAGLRYRLPFGPIRLDYGYNPDQREGEDRGVLHITVGFSF